MKYLLYRKYIKLFSITYHIKKKLKQLFHSSEQNSMHWISTEYVYLQMYMLSWLKHKTKLSLHLGLFFLSICLFVWTWLIELFLCNGWLQNVFIPTLPTTPPPPPPQTDWGWDVMGGGCACVYVWRGGSKSKTFCGVFRIDIATCPHSCVGEFKKDQRTLRALKYYLSHHHSPKDRRRSTSRYLSSWSIWQF